MPDRHVTDEEIWEAGGKAPRMPPAVPKATCLKCLREHVAFYATQSHDCRVDLTDRHTYGWWLDYFRTLGYGVLQDPSDRKFGYHDEISGRTALTFHLQSDLFAGDWNDARVLDHGYYAEFPDFPPEALQRTA